MRGVSAVAAETCLPSLHRHTVVDGREGLAPNAWHRGLLCSNHPSVLSSFSPILRAMPCLPHHACPWLADVEDLCLDTVDELEAGTDNTTMSCLATNAQVGW